jgi:hypothetical protein
MSDNVMLLSDNYIDLAGLPKSVVIWYSVVAKQTFRSSCCAPFQFPLLIMHNLVVICANNE